VSSRHPKIEGVEPVTFGQAREIPGFLEYVRTHPRFANNYEPSEDPDKPKIVRATIPWAVIGYLLIQWWRLTGKEQRAQIAAEERAKAIAELQADAQSRLSVAVSQIGEPQAPPAKEARAAPKRKGARAHRRR
jgi:hypothetical protein